MRVTGGLQSEVVKDLLRDFVLRERWQLAHQNGRRALKERAIGIQRKVAAPGRAAGDDELPRHRSKTTAYVNKPEVDGSGWSEHELLKGAKRLAIGIGDGRGRNVQKQGSASGSLALVGRAAVESGCPGGIGHIVAVRAYGRWVTAQNSGKDYMLYSRRTEDDFTLSLIFAGTTPLRDIRRQGQRLVRPVWPPELSTELPERCNPRWPATSLSLRRASFRCPAIAGE